MGDLYEEQPSVSTNNPDDAEFTVHEVLMQIDNKINIINSSVYLYGELDNEFSSYEIISRIQCLYGLGKRNINLHINSDGGNIQEMFAIYDYIHSIDAKINTICRGKANSAAAILLLSGTGGRFMSVNSNMFLHEVQLELSGPTSQVSTQSTFFEKKQDEFYNILEKYSNKKQDFWRKELQKNDMILSANEALEFGLIDRII